MVAPLNPEQIDKALQRGSREELDEFNRLVEEAHLETMSQLLMESGNHARLLLLRNKLFPTAATEPRQKPKR